MDVNVFHRREVFPAAHGLKRLVVHACTMRACGEGMPEAVRRFTVDIDSFLYALPDALVSLISERGMRISKRGENVLLRVIRLALGEFRSFRQSQQDDNAREGDSRKVKKPERSITVLSRRTRTFSA